MSQETRPEVLVGEGPVRLELHADGVAHLRLSRPDAANGLNVELLRALHEAVLRIHGDGRVRAVLLTGEGKHFCAGGDVHTFLSKGEALPDYIESFNAAGGTIAPRSFAMARTTSRIAASTTSSGVRCSPV